jgi:uncharacterized repeat protein (TIGR01451 family)
MRPLPLFRSAAFIALYFALGASAFAQIPTRVLVNGGFESPDFSALCLTGGAGGPPPTRGYLAATNQPATASIDPARIVTGWRTTDLDTPANTFMCGGTATGGNYAPVQIFRGDVAGPAQEGVQWAELNPEHESRLYQRVCAIPGESINYALYHKRRSAATESARVVLCRDGAGFNQAIECGAVTSQIAVGSVSVINTPDSAWRLVSGILNVTTIAVPTIAEFGFESVTPVGSAGNMIDNTKLALRPVIDIRAAASNVLAEPATNSAITILVNGQLRSAATVILRRAVASTARYGADYVAGTITRGSVAANTTTGDLTVTLPAGFYDPNQASGASAGLITLALNVVDDNIIEATETLTYTIVNADVTGGGGTDADLGTIAGLIHQISGYSANCAAANGSAAFTITDNDQPTLTKAFGAASIAASVSTTLTFTLTSPAEGATATTRVDSQPVTFTDTLPIGLQIADASVALSADCLGTAPTVTAGATSVTISNMVVRGSPPSGNNAAATACTITFNVTNRPGQLNASCVTNPAAFTNGTTNITGLAAATNGVTNSCLVVTPATVNLAISKTNSVTSVRAGGTTTYTIVVSNNGPSSANGSTIADPPTAGLSACMVNSCTPTGGATCPASFTGFFTATGVTVPALPATSSISISVTCNVTATGS